MPFPPEKNNVVELSPLERVGGEPHKIQRASRIIHWIFVAAVAVALLVAWNLASADTLRGHVVSVADGYTITVLDSSNIQHRIRLSGIDAPEKGQPFGNRSKENLSKYDRDVIIEWNKKDRYGRLVWTVFVDGHDANLEQVRAWLAWWYRIYAKEQAPDERDVFELAEKVARARKIGLWRNPEPVPPWEWRRSKK